MVVEFISIGGPSCQVSYLKTPIPYPNNANVDRSPDEHV